MARYYALTYEVDNNLVPIDLSVITSLPNHELSGLIDLTTKYLNEKEFKDELLMANLIPNRDVPLRYAIRQPNRDNPKEYTYTKIRYGNNIYYNNYKNCFDLATAKKYYYDNLLDENFYDRVFYNICCELHAKSLVCNMIEEGLKPANYANFITKLQERINSPRVKDVIKYLEADHYPREKGNIIKRLFDAVNNNPYVLIEFVKRFGDELVINNTKLSNFPSIVALNTMWGMIKTINNNNEANIPTSQNLQTEFDKTFNELWDALTLTKAGKPSDRLTQNVGMFIAHNEYYRFVSGKGRTITTDPVEKLTTEEINSLTKTYVSKDDENCEEFITEEDFTLSGTTPEEQGFHVDSKGTK